MAGALISAVVEIQRLAHSERVGCQRDYCDSCYRASAGPHPGIGTGELPRREGTLPLKEFIIWLGIQRLVETQNFCF